MVNSAAKKKEPAWLPIKCYWCGKPGEVIALDGLETEEINCPKCNKKINVEKANYYSQQDWT